MTVKLLQLYLIFSLFWNFFIIMKWRDSFDFYLLSVDMSTFIWILIFVLVPFLYHFFPWHVMTRQSMLSELQWTRYSFKSKLSVLNRYISYYFETQKITFKIKYNILRFNWLVIYMSKNLRLISLILGDVYHAELERLDEPCLTFIRSSVSTNSHSIISKWLVR